MTNNRTKDTIKCRYCDYRLPRFRKKKDGTNSNWFPRMRDHIERLHENEPEEIRRNQILYGDEY